MIKGENYEGKEKDDENEGKYVTPSLSVNKKRKEKCNILEGGGGRVGGGGGREK